MNNWHIEPMREEHLAALTELDVRCFSHPWTYDGLKAELSSDTAVFAAAVLDGTAVGCAGMHCVCGECYIDKVCVAPELRRQGIARALVDYLISYAEAHHAEFLTLEVRESNAPAIALYTAAGFLPVGKRRNFYTDPREDAVLMTKTLSGNNE